MMEMMNSHIYVFKEKKFFILFHFVQLFKGLKFLWNNILTR